MAYAAIISLKLTLQNTLLHPHRYSIPCEKRDIESLYEKLGVLQRFLEEYPSHQRNENETSLETRIRDAAYEAEDVMDFHIIYPASEGFLSFVIKSSNFVMHLVAAFKNDTHTLYQNKEMMGRTNIKLMVKKVDSLIAEVMMMIKEQTGLEIQGRSSGRSFKWIKIGKLIREDHEDFEPRNGLHQDSSRLVSSITKDIMVGFEDHLMEIKDQLAEESSTLKILSIVGMGGIGKTTLATHAYNDPYVVNHFDIRAWATVSQSYSIRDILLGMLDSMKILTKEMLEASDAQLKLFMYKYLKDRRYLIIVDDIWDTKAWDSLKMMFPDDNKRSRIMLTTQIAHVAEYASPSGTSPLQINPLKDEQSWMLLRAKVFGDEPYPLNLQEIGKTIARDCGGLPLSIVVIGGVLSKVEKTQVAWQSVAENVTSFVFSSGDQCSGVLRLSYNYLPQYLKACFLYMGVFPKSYEIGVSKLTKMWVAEGFLSPDEGRSPEDVAERCVEDLLDRNLILISKNNFKGKIKAFRIHDLLLDFCLEEAKKEKFLQIIKSRFSLFPPGLATERRISIHPMRKLVHYLIPFQFVSCTPYVRSLICIGQCSIDPGMLSVFKLLRVLDVTQVEFPEFPHQVLELVNLRYIALICHGNIPSSITKLWHLQTLIIVRNWPEESKYYLPVEIWTMAHLKHVRCDGGHLPDPSAAKFDIICRKKLVLEDLQTLSGLWNLVFTEELLQRIPNIKKIEVNYKSSHLKEWSDYQLENLANLRQLKALKIRVFFPVISLLQGLNSPTRFEFPLPASLNTLTLAGVGIPWGDLAIIGSLPNLEVLKLVDHACIGTEWKPNEEEFCKLKTLVLERLKLKHWEADSCHFPSLQRLIIRRCGELVEIPSGMGESPTLDMIELSGCQASVFDSAMKIREKQHSYGNYGFQVICPETSVWDSVAEVVTDVFWPPPRVIMFIPEPLIKIK
ncbi:putative late blight resistance protein homolog R1A-3 [Henckelia pumila]|uniref:putative late blight resistance protein homolog R1A-3 n=1 Tax=Henckelia pumila TaxID=405737 RepID=UPI003C6E7804